MMYGKDLASLLVVENAVCADEETLFFNEVDHNAPVLEIYLRALAHPRIRNRCLGIRSVGALIQGGGLLVLEVPQADCAVGLLSSRLRKLDDLDADIDLQVDVSPFISVANGKGTSVAAEAEVFIGIKTPVEDWEETEK
ncbi:hypothetical protein IL306_007249 [Fusarium sp. DS 682]|nr:hypothetical protein IL306_007249 [Fusarium sp. DS 682]